MRPVLTYLISSLLSLLVLLAAPASMAAASTLRIGTTHTIRDSGLLDYLMPKFEADTGIKPQLLIAGTGQVLRYAAQGDVDVLFTHSPEDEMRLVKAGDGLSRRAVMASDFVMVGPAADPLKLRDLTDAVAALQRIQQAAHPFVSRGDDSGTHKMEQRLWQQAGLRP
ncbi:MAG: substrate-binding domain-containing protein, partial [Betaproteobacteria bacterium]|nr:substrate-binding domain-containing protein [Betaproteobacteria bacterium]